MNLISRILPILILLVGLVLPVSPLRAADDITDRENKIKIAYLFHFSQFTEWAIKPTVFTYCVYDDEHFSELLKRSYVNKMLGESKVNVIPIDAQSNLDNCQLVYFPNAISADLLARIRKKPILSVGGQKNILEQGIIYLFEEDEKVRFFINNSSAIAAGLKISSQLLSLSKEPSL